MVAAVDWAFQQRTISSSLSTSGTLHSSVFPYQNWTNNAPLHHISTMSRYWCIVERVGANPDSTKLRCNVHPLWAPLLNALV